jgi:RND family efflux transporter MFP subunit
MSENLNHDLKSLRIDRGKESGSGRHGRWILMGVTAVVIVAAAGGLVFRQPSSPLLDFLAKPREVEVAAAVRNAPPKDGVALTAGGYVVPRRRVEVSSKISGRVEQLLVDRGAYVKVGQVLARLDDREIRAQLNQARAAREAAAARLNEALAGSRPQEIERAQATLQQAEATMNTARTNLQRARELQKKGVLSTQALDDAQNAYDVSAAQVEIARRNHDLARIGPRQEQIQLARAQLAEAEAAVQWLETQLENTVIRAPVSGTVLERLIELGEMVTTGFVSGRGAKAALVSIADLNDLEVELDISEADISRVKPEQRCRVSPDAYPDHKYDARVREIAPEANRQKATIQVKVSIARPDQYLRPETNAKVQFLEVKEDAGPSSGSGIFLPKAAFVEGPAVFLVKDGHAVKRRVVVGQETGTQVEVVSGLSGGEQVIVRGLDGLTEGARVRAKQ